ncbi:ninein-like protein isoform X3 [Macrobrachium nipponense]|uniref:ninein-like protein isoform X3 n=1 Tax=Macrobrachium nipponense TaxID=159736 RepID=UPI0030C8BDC0
MASRSTSRTPEEQLRSLFSECELTPLGSLTLRGLQQLCAKLQLGNCTNELLNRLRKHRLKVCGPYTPKTIDDPLQDVTFDEFREVFIFLLSEQEHLSSTSILAHGDMSTEESSYGTAEEVIMEGCSNATLTSNDGASRPDSQISVTQPLEELEEKLSEPVVQEASSQPPSLSYSGDNEEEYLRATWQRLGVGHDGYLSLDELATVCHAIGMEKVANEVKGDIPDPLVNLELWFLCDIVAQVLEQLFSRLDVDGDGRISFEEFLHMFQNGGPSGNTSLVLDESQHQEVPGTPLSRMSSVSDDRRGGTGTESGVFSSVDPDNTGYASVETILELWESLSIGNGVSLLKEMGFPHRPHDRLSLADLSTALEEECRVTDDQAATTTATPVQLAVITYLHEIKFLRLSLDSARGERNKLRFDLNEANQRLALLAQELDEHNAHMEASSQHQIQELERQYRDQVRELQEAITRERDAARDQVSSVMRELQSQNSQLLQEDSKLKAKLSTLHADIKRLETENFELSEKLQEAQRQISQMEKQLVDLQELRKKVAEFESLSPREEEYRRLLDRLERVTAENQQLRDNNDELLSQMDSFPLRQNHARNSDKESLDGSCLGDYVDPPIGLLAPVKRRGSNSGSGDDSCEEESPRGVKVRRCSKGLNVHYVDVGSYDESFLDTSMSSLLKGGIPGLQNLDTSQPPSLDELSSKVRRKNSGQSDVSDGGFMKETGSPSFKNASQLLNRELKQVFRHVRASVKEEYKKDGSDCDSDRSYEGESKRMRRTTPEVVFEPDSRYHQLVRRDLTHLQKEKERHQKLDQELEAELVKLREERDRLAKQLALQQEEFAHQLEKKEFEVEQALEECTGIKEQLEKTTTQLNLSFPDTNSSSLPISSTPVKSTHSGPTSLKDKGQLLTMALEELEMALRREEQERAQRISVEALLAKRSDGDSSTESIGGETTTTYPQTPSEPSSAAKLLLKGLGAPNGEGRVRVLEEQCRGLEGELARVRVEVLKMVEERDQLLQQKEDLEKRRESEGSETMKERIRNLIEKIKKKRQSHSPKTEENSLENARDCVKQEGDVSVSSQIKSSSSCADGKKDPVSEDDSSKQEDAVDEVELLEGEVSTLEKELAHEQDNLEKQKASLLEKNGKLEQDIEILRIELDKSEDYWTLKLQEEQDYYEEERRLYDDKFSALEKKIREYEELVLSGGGNGRDISEESDRLSTIDESAVWEKQVTDLEEEVSMLRKQIDELREERFNMECGWKACVDDERQKAAQECGKLQEQISSLTTQLHQAQHQVNSVFEELDKVRRESENRVRDLADQNRLNIQGSGSTGEETINGSLRSQLRQCQNRLRYLEAALRQHHTHAHHILSVTRQQHAAEVQNLESMITATQQMLGQHIAKYKDQLSKASKSDSLVRELYLENAQLMRALQITESRQKAAEETGRQLQIAALDQKMT